MNGARFHLGIAAMEIITHIHIPYIYIIYDFKINSRVRFFMANIYACYHLSYLLELTNKRQRSHTYYTSLLTFT